MQLANASSAVLYWAYEEPMIHPIFSDAKCIALSSNEAQIAYLQKGHQSKD